MGVVLDCIHFIYLPLSFILMNEVNLMKLYWVCAACLDLPNLKRINLTILTDTYISLTFNIYAFSHHRSDVTKPRQQGLIMLHWMTPGLHTTICRTLVVNMQMLASPKKQYITTTIRLATITCVAKVRITKQKITVIWTSNSSRKVSINRRIEGDLPTEVEAIRLTLLGEKVDGTGKVKMISR